MLLKMQYVFLYIITNRMTTVILLLVFALHCQPIS